MYIQKKLVLVCAGHVIREYTKQAHLFMSYPVYARSSTLKGFFVNCNINTTRDIFNISIIGLLKFSIIYLFYTRMLYMKVQECHLPIVVFVFVRLRYDMRIDLLYATVVG